MLAELSKRTRLAVVLMGDLIETDKAFMSQYMIEDVKIRTYEQLAGVIQQLNPVKDNCLAAVWGNHEERLIRSEKTKRMLEFLEIDFYEETLKRLNPNIIVGGFSRGLLLNIKVKNQNYVVRVNHGSYGGYRQPELQNKRESRNYPTVGLIAMGHTHQMFWRDHVYLGMDKDHRTVAIQHWLGTGTMLRYPSYAERKGYPINIMGCPIVKLYSDVQHIEYVNTPSVQPRFLKKSGMLPLPSIKPFRQKLASIFRTKLEKKTPLKTLYQSSVKNKQEQKIKKVIYPE